MRKWTGLFLPPKPVHVLIHDLEEFEVHFVDQLQLSNIHPLKLS